MIKTRDFVRSVLGPRYAGRVADVHGSFAETGAGDAWFRRQIHEWPEETLNERWVSFLVDGGGSVLFPERVSPFPLNNQYAVETFGRGLVDWLPREFLWEYHDTRAAKLLDRNVVKSWSACPSDGDEPEWKSWPGRGTGAFSTTVTPSAGTRTRRSAGASRLPHLAETRGRRGRLDGGTGLQEDGPAEKTTRCTNPGKREIRINRNGVRLGNNTLYEIGT